MDKTTDHSVTPLEDPEGSKSAYFASQDKARVLAANSHSANTLKSYRSDWQHFEKWCSGAAAHDPAIAALPTNDVTLATYVGHEIHTRPNTLKRRFAGIRFVHIRAGYPSPFLLAPAFDAAFHGHKRLWAGKNTTPRQASCTEDCMRRMADVWSDDSNLLAVRNRALLLLGFDGALRRSELVALDVECVSVGNSGISLLLPTSKGDQYGIGQSVQLCFKKSSYCSAKALQHWLSISEICEGAIFRRFLRRGQSTTLSEQRLSDQSVYHIIKQTAVEANLQGNYGAHSLRRGFINSAFEAQASIHDIQNHVRHSHPHTTMRYLQRVDNQHSQLGIILLK